MLPPVCVAAYEFARKCTAKFNLNPAPYPFILYVASD
jgi:hypothetical protein